MPTRITNQLMSENFITDLRRNLRTLSQHQRQLSTGLIVSRAEDNPQTIGTIIRMNEQIADMDQYEVNSLLARDFLDNSESALSRVSVNLQRVRELIIRAANGINDASDRTAMRPEFTQMLDDIVASANQRFGDQFLFSGTKTGVEPFSLNTGTLVVTYSGNNSNIVREIDTGQTIVVNQAGDDGAGTGVFQTVFGALKTAIDAIDANDPAILSNGAITEIDTAITGVLQSRTSLGARSSRMATNVTRLQNVRLRSQAFRSKLQDLDIAEGVTQLATAETTYRASLAIGARILQPSLLDFLR
jgi:flagellar hook-associated protein 3 FlgL